MTNQRLPSSAAWLTIFVTVCLMASPAEARRRFGIIPIFGGGGGGESIELVHDLPDTAPFVDDGKNYDVGFLTGSERRGYVLYSGDAFKKLGPAEILMLKDMLGFDPTAKHKADHAEENAAAAKDAAEEKAHKDQLIATGRMIEREPGETQAAYQVRVKAFAAKHKRDSAARAAARAARGEQPEEASESSSGFGGFWMFFLIVLLGTGWKFRSFIGRSLTSSEASGIDQDHPAPSVPRPNSQSFDVRVSQRLAELEREPLAANNGMTAPPSRSGFGRRGL